MASLIVHGLPLSQPVRAVLWALVRKRKAFRLAPKVPGSPEEDGTRHPSFLAMNPGGTMPCIEEPETGFVLGESNAILCYLARTHGWDDLYPEDPRAAAKVDWYLHFHHQSVRQASIGYIAPAFRRDLQIPEHIVGGAKAATEYALGALDTGPLANSRFIGGDGLTVADLAAYGDLGQLRREFTNLYDFSKYPNVQRWLDDMMQADGHDDVHVALAELGDISVVGPTVARLGEVNAIAIEALGRQVAGFAD